LAGQHERNQHARDAEDRIEDACVLRILLSPGGALPRLFFLFDRSAAAARDVDPGVLAWEDFEALVRAEDLLLLALLGVPCEAGFSDLFDSGVDMLGEPLQTGPDHCRREWLLAPAARDD